MTHTSSPSQDNQIDKLSHDMAVPLYAFYSVGDTARLLHISDSELLGLCKQKRIACIQLTDSKLGFFGHHILRFLMRCAVSDDVANDNAPDKSMLATTSPAPSPAVLSPTVKLLSVNDTLALIGIGRTKLYQLLNNHEIDFVKIGKRTLIKRQSLDEFLDNNIA